MPDSTIQITDYELSRRLNESFIDPTQQKQLEALIPQMNEGEKGELLRLIDRSHEEKKKADTAYQQNMETLGKEFNQRLRDEDKGFRKELEGMERTEDAQTLKVVEAEVYAVGAQSSQLKTHSSKGHFVRNLIFVVLFLGVLAGGALYLLNHLS